LKLPKEARPILEEIRKKNFPWDDVNFYFYGTIKQAFKDLVLDFQNEDFYTALWFLLKPNFLLTLCCENLEFNEILIREVTWKILDRRLEGSEKCRKCFEKFISEDKYNPPICRLRQSLCIVSSEKKIS